MAAVSSAEGTYGGGGQLMRLRPIRTTNGDGRRLPAELILDYRGRIDDDVYSSPRVVGELARLLLAGDL